MVHASAITFLSYPGLDMNSLFQAETISNVPCLIHTNMVRKPASNMKNGKVARPSGVVSKPLKVAKARRTIYWAKFKAEQKILENAVWRDYHK